MLDPVIEHFHKTASEFDSIYTGKKGMVSRFLDRLLRWDMIVRLNRTVDVVRSHQNPTVLDIGAGTGRFFSPMLKAGASHIYAVEPADNMVKIAEELVRVKGVEEKITIIHAPWPEAVVPEKCDVSIAIGFYDYIEDPLPSLKRSRELTKSAMVASFPRANTLRARIRTVRLNLRGCPTYYYTKKGMDALVKEAGFSEWSYERFGQLHFIVAKP